MKIKQDAAKPLAHDDEQVFISIASKKYGIIWHSMWVKNAQVLIHRLYRSIQRGILTAS